MTRLVKLVVVVVIAVGLATAGLGMLLGHGFSAREEPTAFEAFFARRLRLLAIPRRARDATNPLAATPEVLEEALAHFADHCASCHGNDGSGNTAIGQNLYPKAPDMRQEGTQSLSDGELFYIIHNGIRFTGMPAWGSGRTEEDQGSWKLVHFIRHLPAITPEEIAEMKRLNPKSRHQLEEEEEMRKFLAGEANDGGPDGHQH